MSRRSSILDDLFAVGVRLPWPVAIGLALLSFLVLHFTAAHFAVNAHPASMSDLAAVVQRSWITTIATIFQFVVPAVLVTGAAASLVKRGRTRATFDRVSGLETNALAGLSWSEFEAIIGEGFRRQGFSVSGNVQQGPDGGVDLVLTKDSERALVQCKHWSRTSVGVTVLREFYGVMTSKSIRSGYVVTSGRFTHYARAFAASCGIELIDGERLRDWMADTNRGSSNVPVQPLPRTSVTKPGLPQPACPACGADTILRTARQGKSVGEQFWGCSRFPKCRGTVDA
jgi:restriction system protein